MERKEAIEVIKKNWPDSSFTMLREALETLIPEFKESEDERIRKTLIDYFNTCHGDYYGELKRKDILAWLEKQSESIEINPSEFDLRLNRLLKQFESLPKEELISSLSFYLNVVQNDSTYKEEKQCEQKPIDKVESKFKVGDYIERKDGLGCHAKIILVGENAYACEKLIHSEDYSPFFELMFENQDEFRISLDFQQKPTDDKVEPKFKVGDWILYSGDHYEGVRHITKIDENGYYIERNGLPYGIIPFNHEICMRLWTIQDAKDGDVLIKSNKPFIYNGNYDCSYVGSYCGISIEGKFTVSTKRCYWTGNSNIYPATKEQRDTLIKAMADAGYTFDFDKKELKKIEQKSIWSEEDEKMFSELLSSLLINTSDQWIKYGKWLKSLKGRITWKPTEPQLVSLTIACDRNDRVGFELTQLLKELKKL